MSPRRPVFITSGRHPFEVGPLAACVVVGMWLTFVDERPPSMTRTLPPSFLTAWLIMIAAGGLLGLIGAFWRGDVDDALLIEFAGVSLVASMCTLYVVVLFVANPLNAISAAGLLAGIAGGAIFRVGQIALDWLRLRRARPDVPTVEIPLLTSDDKRDA